MGAQQTNAASRRRTTQLTPALNSRKQRTYRRCLPRLPHLTFRLERGVEPQAAWLLTIAAFAFVDGVLLVMTVLEWVGVGTPLSS
jgi:hypothetical protein